MQMDRLTVASLMYMGWIVAHYVSSHIYVRFCTPPTLLGFILSPFTASSAHCIGLRWVIYTGGNNIMFMWFLGGLWLMKYTMIQEYKHNPTE